MATVIIGSLVIGAFAAAGFHTYKQKKLGKSSCGCGCSGCPNASACHKL